MAQMFFIKALMTFPGFAVELLAALVLPFAVALLIPVGKWLWIYAAIGIAALGILYFNPSVPGNSLGPFGSALAYAACQAAIYGALVHKITSRLKARKKAFAATLGFLATAALIFSGW